MDGVGLPGEVIALSLQGKYFFSFTVRISDPIWKRAMLEVSLHHLVWLEQHSIQILGTVSNDFQLILLFVRYINISAFSAKCFPLKNKTSADKIPQTS